MAFYPNLLQVSISPNDAEFVQGKTSTIYITAANNNPADWAYHLSLKLTLPDGVSYVSSVVPPISQTNNPNGSITLMWDNVKDLAPNETDFIFPVTLQAEQTFRATGLQVPLATKLSRVTLTAAVDDTP